MSQNGEAAAINYELRTRLNTVLNIAFDTSLVLSGDEGPHIRFGIHSILDFQSADTRRQFFYQRICYISHRYDHRDCHTAFAGGTVSRADQGVTYDLEIGIG